MRVLVTGSSRGLGKAIATTFIAADHDVVIHGTTALSPMTLGEFDGTMANLTAHLGAATYIVGDLSIPNNPFITDLLPFDIVINCAGGDIGRRGVIGDHAGKPHNNNPVDIVQGDVMSLFERNFLTTYNVCRSVVPSMITRRSGSIINIGSMNVNLSLPESSIYSAMKAAVHHYTRTLATYLRPYGVRVNCVAPGGTLTPRFLASRLPPANLLQQDDSFVRYAQPTEVAQAVYDVAVGLPFTTGQIIYVDGGMSA